VATDQNDELLRALSGQLGDIAGLLGEIRDRLPEPAEASSGPGEELNVVELREPATDQDPARAEADIELAEPGLPAPTPDAALLREPTTPARKAATKVAPRRASKTKEAP
jgi:hypothetical protein